MNFRVCEFIPQKSCCKTFANSSYIYAHTVERECSLSDHKSEKQHYCCIYWNKINRKSSQFLLVFHTHVNAHGKMMTWDFMSAALIRHVMQAYVTCVKQNKCSENITTWLILASPFICIFPPFSYIFSLLKCSLTPTSGKNGAKHCFSRVLIPSKTFSERAFCAPQSKPLQTWK